MNLKNIYIKHSPCESHIEILNWIQGDKIRLDLLLLQAYLFYLAFDYYSHLIIFQFLYFWIRQVKNGCNNLATMRKIEQSTSCKCCQVLPIFIVTYRLNHGSNRCLAFPLCKDTIWLKKIDFEIYHSFWCFIRSCKVLHWKFQMSVSIQLRLSTHFHWLDKLSMAIAGLITDSIGSHHFSQLFHWNLSAKPRIKYHLLLLGLIYFPLNFLCKLLTNKHKRLLRWVYLLFPIGTGRFNTFWCVLECMTVTGMFRPPADLSKQRQEKRIK